MVIQEVVFDILPRSRMWIEAAVRVVALFRKSPREIRGNHNAHFRPIRNRVSSECEYQKCFRCDVPEDKAHEKSYDHVMLSWYKKMKLRSGLFCNAPLPCTPLSNEIVYNQPSALYERALVFCSQWNMCRLVNGKEWHHQHNGKIFKGSTFLQAMKALTESRGIALLCF
jgi:hypothetical protein